MSDELRKTRAAQKSISMKPDAYEFEVGCTCTNGEKGKVSINDSVLPFQREIRKKEENKDSEGHTREFSYRSLIVTSNACRTNANDDRQMNAQYENGILKIRIAKEKWNGQ